MKKRGFLGMVVASALLLLTSCLGDSNNQQTLSSIPGVISTSKDYKTIIKTAAGAAIYSPSLETAGYLPGQCVLASFTIDFDAAENANAASNGYYYATMNAVPDNVDRWYANPIMGDTTKLLDKEQAVTSPIPRRSSAQKKQHARVSWGKTTNACPDHSCQPSSPRHTTLLQTPWPDTMAFSRVEIT